MKRGIIFLIFTYCILTAFPLPSDAMAEERPEGIVKEIAIMLEKAYNIYAEGDFKNAKAYVSEAYFDVFEGKGLEAQIGVISPSRKTELEALFGKIIGLMGSGAEPSEVRSTIDEITKELSLTARAMEKERGDSNAVSLFINALIIILREGFEAILIISALAAYLVKIGRGDRVKTVYTGAVLALLASIVAALIFQLFLTAAGASKEALEGITMLLAAVVLFYVSYWLISKVQIIKWQRYIKSKVEGSLSKGQTYALGFAAFLAVFREGAETVLFYQALYSSANGGLLYLLGGFGVGTVMLIGIFFAFKYGTIKIPLGAFFAATSTLLYYLAFTFAGKGVLELQGAGWVSTTAIKGVPAISILGIYPNWEGIALQLFLIIALVVAVVYSFILKPYYEREERLREVSHIGWDISQLHETLEHIRQHARMSQKLYPETTDEGGKEIHEMRGHLIEIDSKVHEVIGHLHRLEETLSDIFKDFEKGVKGEA